MANSLNYVWINNRSYYDPASFSSGSPIPVEFLQNAFEVAAQNPGVTARIWCDFDLMSEEQKHFLLKMKSKPKNLTIRSLCDIKAYLDMPVFEKRRSHAKREPKDWTIWHKVDMARMIVLEHALVKEKDEIAYYSDMDIQSLNLQDHRLASIVKTFGMVCNQNGTCIENQFLGLHKKRRSWIRNNFIPSILDGFEQGYSDGWWGFTSCVEKLAIKSKTDPYSLCIEIKSLSGAPCTEYVFDKAKTLHKHSKPLTLAA